MRILLSIANIGGVCAACYALVGFTQLFSAINTNILLVTNNSLVSIFFSAECLAGKIKQGLNSSAFKCWNKQWFKQARIDKPTINCIFKFKYAAGNNERNWHIH